MPWNYFRPEKNSSRKPGIEHETNDIATVSICLVTCNEIAISKESQVNRHLNTAVTFSRELNMLFIEIVFINLVRGHP
jgi:hypothetical protein